MECEYIRKNLFRIAEESIHAPEMAAIEDHLHTCKECTGLLVEFRKTLDLIEKDIASEPAPFISTRILHYLEMSLYPEQQTGRRSVYHLLQPAVMTLSLIFALFAGFSIGKKGSGSLKVNSPERKIESIRTDLYISDFTDEDKTFFLNP